MGNTGNTRVRITACGGVSRYMTLAEFFADNAIGGEDAAAIEHDLASGLAAFGGGALPLIWIERVAETLS